MPVFIIKSTNKFYNAKWIVLSGLFLGIGSLILMPIIQIILSITTVLGAGLVLWGIILWIWSFFNREDYVVSANYTSSSTKPHSSVHKDSSTPKIIVQKSDEK
jgi:hypothetical protein